MKVIIKFLSNVLLRFYSEVIAGIWAVILLIPLDNALYKFFTGTSSYPMSKYYVAFFICYTLFFLVSGALIPIIKKHRIVGMINNLEKTKQISSLQKKKILFTIKDITNYQSLFTKEGFLHFLMENIFSIGVMFSWFGIEGIISNVMHGETLIVPILFIILFFATLILESFLDDFIAENKRSMKKMSSINNKFYDYNKQLIMQLVEDIGGGGSSSENLGRLLLEDTIEDIAEIMNMPRRSLKGKNQAKHNSLKESRKKVSGRKHMHFVKNKSTIGNNTRNKQKRTKKTIYSNY
ncbi:MAG: hypothetical protein IJT15_02865 [Rickettsiales bacterium]|nr:hypothetical protein [Rickettsiales bacterium]